MDGAQILGACGCVCRGYPRGKGTEGVSACLTRLNVLDTRNLAAYEPGGHIYPGAPALGRKDLERSGIIEAAVKKTLGGTLREGEFVRVELPDLLSLLRELPFDEDLANMWDPPMLVRVLERMAPRYGNRGFIYYRPMKRRNPILPTGAL